MSILEYIQRTWSTLTRSHRDLASAAVDPKGRPLPDGRWPVYVSRNEDLQHVDRFLRGQMQPSALAKIDLRQLPEDVTRIAEHGLLYLPRPYVVPGGRFNEMYGWDSYFIQLGLLRDGHLNLARDMAENVLYEIREYGMILNANRTYYLTRSQPPLLTEILLAVYRRTQDRDWLERSWSAIELYYLYWTNEPHLTPRTGLSRYYDLGEGPAPEVLVAEIDAHGHNDYDLIRQYFRAHRIDAYDVAQYYDSKTNTLTPLLYKGDRSVRESGFDPSSRFGPFSIDIIHYNPVCLNSLLYLMETQMAEIASLLGRKESATLWKSRAADRADRINQLMWDAQDGFYYDYNVTLQRPMRYPFLTTFYPLWTGIASQEQAARVVRNLGAFERPGGLQTSTHRSGDQWDAPFGWAPLQWIAVQGLRRYGYEAEAYRVSNLFLSLVKREYERSGTLEEKYDVDRQTADVDRRLRFGYHSNEAGFGWTNAVFTGLFDQLGSREKSTILALGKSH